MGPDDLQGRECGDPSPEGAEISPDAAPGDDISSGGGRADPSSRIGALPQAIGASCRRVGTLRPRLPAWLPGVGALCRWAGVFHRWVQWPELAVALAQVPMGHRRLVATVLGTG
jgi:hypothetical protein